jgi:putative membrane protein
MRDNLRQSEILGDKKTREDCERNSFPPLPSSRTSPSFKFAPCFRRQTEAFFWNADFYRANMQLGTKRSRRFLEVWLINTLAVLVAYYIVPGIHFGRWSDLLIASALLGILNAFIRPILMFFALPLLIFTLGLFTFVINALLLYGIGWLMGLWGLQFTVDTFWSSFFGAFIISVVSVTLNILTGTGSTRVTFSHRQPPPRKSDDDGPVIDV